MTVLERAINAVSSAISLGVMCGSIGSSSIGLPLPVE